MNVPTLPMNSLQSWADGASIKMESTACIIQELSLAELRNLVLTYSSHLDLLERVKTLFESHTQILDDARSQVDCFARGFGMQSLPVELIRCIFQMVCFTDEEHVSGLYTKARDPRLDPRFQLAHVGQFWREVVLGTSELWNAIYITYSTPPEYISFIAQIHSSPLDITLDSKSASKLSADSALVVQRFQDLYHPIASRCRAINFEFADTEVCMPLMKQLASPGWREVRLGRWDRGYGYRYMHSWLHLPPIAAPNVSSLISLNPLTFNPTLAHQLTTLQLECSLHDLFNPLIFCPNLRDVTLRLAALEPDPIDNPQIVTAPHLTKLHLAFEKDKFWNGVSHVVQYLNAPAIETLVLFAPLDSPDLIHALRRVLEEMDGPFGLAGVTTIKASFSLQDCDHCFALLQLFYCFPHVRRLECSGVPVTFRWERMDAGSGRFLSTLDTLVLNHSISFWGPERVSDNVAWGIIEILKSVDEATELEILIGRPFGRFADLIRKKVQEVDVHPLRLRIGLSDTGVHIPLPTCDDDY